MPDFRIVSQRNGVLLAPQEVEVMTSLDRFSSSAILKSESPILAETDAFIGDTIEIDLGERRIFKGQVDVESDIQSVDGGSAYSITVRSISRNIEDSYIQNPLTVKEKFENVTLDKIFMRTFDLEGFAVLDVDAGNIGRGVFDPSDNGFQTQVDSFKWFEADNLGTELRHLCAEYKCVLTDDDLGVLHAYNFSDFTNRDAQTIDTRQKSIERRFDHTRRYSRYIGFAAQRTSKGKSTQFFRGEFVENREVDRRWFARIYREALNETDLEEAIRFDANRRRMNGLEIRITIPGLAYFEKGTPVNLQFNTPQIRRYPSSGWIINVISWKKSLARGSETMVTLVPIEQFNPNPEPNGTFEMTAYEPPKPE